MMEHMVTISPTMEFIYTLQQQQHGKIIIEKKRGASSEARIFFMKALEIRSNDW